MELILLQKENLHQFLKKVKKKINITNLLNNLKIQIYLKHLECLL